MKMPANYVVENNDKEKKMILLLFTLVILDTRFFTEKK